MDDTARDAVRTLAIDVGGTGLKAAILDARGESDLLVSTANTTGTASGVAAAAGDAAPRETSPATIVTSPHAVHLRARKTKPNVWIGCRNMRKSSLPTTVSGSASR
jgi:predicted NBD/HSP70 family sugar kinase